MPAQTLSPGTLLDGRYEIIRVIGRGGFGITYEAVNRINGQRVAIKEHIAPEGAADPARSRDKFLREARTLRDFAGETAIVTALDYLEENGGAFLIMEYLDGTTLHDYIKQNGPLPTERAVRLFTPVMDALTRMHAAGVIHRDISPDNLMVMADGKLKLMDFGAAKEYAQSPYTHSVVYKPSYSPPEQMDKTGVMGTYTDVYALCGTMYYCITGKAPEDVISRLLLDELVRPSKLGADIKPAAEQILISGLALDSDDRIQTIDMVRNELNRLYPDLSEEEKKAAAARKRRFHRRIAVAAGILLAAGLVLAFFNRVRLRFLTIDTISANLDGSHMTQEEFAACSEAIRERLDALTDGWYLMEKYKGRKTSVSAGSSEDAIGTAVSDGASADSETRDDQILRVTVPREVFHDTDPQMFLRCTISRNMDLSILVPSLQKPDLGVFDKTKDFAEVTTVMPDDPMWDTIAEALGYDPDDVPAQGDAAGTAGGVDVTAGGTTAIDTTSGDAAAEIPEFDSETPFYYVRFSDDACRRFRVGADGDAAPTGGDAPADGAAPAGTSVLDTKGTLLKFVFDEQMAQEYSSLPRVWYSFYTIGDGRSAVFPSFRGEDIEKHQIDDKISLPSELILLHLKQPALPDHFIVSADFSVRWEDPASAMLPGKEQLRENKVPGHTMLFKFPVQGESFESMHFNGELVSLQMNIKYRLDQMGIPYAAGFDRYNQNSLIFKIPVDRLWYIELEHLADHLEYDSRIGTPYNTDPAMQSNYFGKIEVADQPDGSFSILVTPRYYADQWKAALEKYAARGLPVVLYFDGIAAASCDAAEALATLEADGVVPFTRWVLPGFDAMTEDTRHFAQFLAASIVQSPQSFVSMSSVEIMDLSSDSRTGLEALRSNHVLPDYIPEDQSDLAMDWHARYPNPDYEVWYSNIIPYSYTIYSFSCDLHDPSKYKAFIEEILTQDREAIAQGKARSLELAFFNRASNEDPNTSMRLYCGLDCLTGELVITRIFGYGEEYEEVIGDWSAVFGVTP